MNLLNERVEHVIYGAGSIVDVKEHSIRVRFPDPVGEKEFLFPEAFEQYLRAIDADAENNILEALRAKTEQIKLERERKPGI